MKRKTFYLLIIFAIIIFLFNVIIYFLLFGNSVFIILLILFLITSLSLLGYYFLKFYHLHSRNILNVKQESNLDQEVAIQNLQSQAMKTLKQVNFIIHKRILFIEFVIIIILFTYLLIRIW